jgi:tRNA threonylcarbamoyladenosine biosynthesis protein TsaE
MNLTYTLQDLSQVATSVLSSVQSKTLLFYGEMGVGKTTLIKALAAEMGVRDTLTSPTFSIVNEHSLDGGTLYHFDCYRLETEEEALDIGIEDYFESGEWIFVEWPENISSLLPEQYEHIKLAKNNNGSRTLNIMPVN